MSTFIVTINKAFRMPKIKRHKKIITIKSNIGILSVRSINKYEGNPILNVVTPEGGIGSKGITKIYRDSTSNNIK